MKEDTEFSGFGPEAISFLSELEANNNRTWFQSRKSLYEAAVVRPAVCLATALAAKLAKHTPSVEAEPFIGGSLFRIQRDVRFSRDKRPYKTHVGIRLRDRDTTRSARCTGPLFYVEFDSRRLRLGAGIKEFNPPMIQAYRRWLQSAENARNLQAAIDEALEPGAEIVADRRVRPPAYAAHLLHADLFCWKGMFVQKEQRLPRTVSGSEFADHCFRQLVSMGALFTILRAVSLGDEHLVRLKR